MNALAEIVRQEIAREGAIPFARFMELALYHPTHGYYERPDVHIGRRGDFFTSVSVGELFGELLAFQFAQWLRPEAEAGGRPGEAALVGLPQYQIVEAGAHDGQLALDVVTYLTTYQPEWVDRLEYWIIEPSPRRQQQQREILQRPAFKVRWFENWAQVPEAGVCGVIFANELLDAFPVVRLGWDAGARKWFEWGVGSRGDHFVWARMSWLASPEASEFPRISNLPIGVQQVLADGFVTEICPAAVKWWRDAARTLRCGRLLTLDYGSEEQQFLRPEYANGTLRTFARHRSASDPLTQVGSQDLTADVDFTAIQRAGLSGGLRTEELVSQERFLTRIAARIWEDARGFPPWTLHRVRQFLSLTHPTQMGHTFRVLVQSRLGPFAT